MGALPSVHIHHCHSVCMCVMSLSCVVKGIEGLYSLYQYNMLSLPLSSSFSISSVYSWVP